MVQKFSWEWALLLHGFHWACFLPRYKSHSGQHKTTDLMSIPPPKTTDLMSIPHLHTHNKSLFLPKSRECIKSWLQAARPYR